MVVLTVTMVVAIVGIAALILLKWWETTSGKILLPATRMRADETALSVKARLMRFARSAKRFPAISILVMRYFIHLGAKAFARFARKAETGAHKLADRVSHKHRFQRRESNSQFLKEVAEHRNENRGSAQNAL